MRRIELVWAHTKGNVGRQYDQETTFSTVGIRLDNEFEKLGRDGSVIERIINHVRKIEKRFVNDCEGEDRQDSLEADDKDSDDDDLKEIGIDASGSSKDNAIRLDPPSDVSSDGWDSSASECMDSEEDDETSSLESEDAS